MGETKRGKKEGGGPGGKMEKTTRNGGWEEVPKKNGAKMVTKKGR